MTRRDYLLSELRCASLRARLWQADIDAVGMALKGGLIEPERTRGAPVAWSAVPDGRHLGNTGKALRTGYAGGRSHCGIQGAARSRRRAACPRRRRISAAHVRTLNMNARADGEYAEDSFGKN